MSKIKLIREKYQYVDKQTGEIKDRTLGDAANLLI